MVNVENITEKEVPPGSAKCYVRSNCLVAATRRRSMYNWNLRLVKRINNIPVVYRFTEAGEGEGTRCSRSLMHVYLFRRRKLSPSNHEACAYKLIFISTMYSSVSMNMIKSDKNR